MSKARVTEIPRNIIITILVNCSSSWIIRSIFLVTFASKFCSSFHAHLVSKYHLMVNRKLIGGSSYSRSRPPCYTQIWPLCFPSIPRSSLMALLRLNASDTARMATIKPIINIGIRFHLQPRMTCTLKSIALRSPACTRFSWSTALNQFSGVHESIGYGTWLGYGSLLSVDARTTSMVCPLWSLVMMKVKTSADKVSKTDNTVMTTQKW